MLYRANMLPKCYKCKTAGTQIGGTGSVTVSQTHCGVLLDSSSLRLLFMESWRERKTLCRARKVFCGWWFVLCSLWSGHVSASLTFMQLLNSSHISFSWAFMLLSELFTATKWVYSENRPKRVMALKKIPWTIPLLFVAASLSVISVRCSTKSMLMKE